MTSDLTFLLSGTLLLASPSWLAADGPPEPARLPAVEIVDGHPIRTVLPPDAIMALDEPPVASMADAGWMDPGEKVIGIVRGGAARAYPLRQLDWHEVINDRLGDQPIAVTW